MIQSGQPDLVSFNEVPKRLINFDYTPTLKAEALATQNIQFWISLDILELLVELSDSDYFIPIRQLFDQPIQKCPNIVIIGLAQIKPKSGGPLLDELYSQLFPLYVLNHANSIEMLEALWKINQNLMIEAICELYKKENSQVNLSRVLDITQEIKESLIPITNSRDFQFSVSLGVLAGKRDFLHFDQWITERMQTIGSPFISALLDYIEEHIIIPCKQSQDQVSFETILERSQLTLESIAIIFEKLVSSNTTEKIQQKLSLRNKNRASEQFASVVRFFPNLAQPPQNAQEVEEISNEIFQKIFKDEIKIPELIELMMKYKNSTSKNENEIFACIIYNLFEEYRYLNQYPKRELQLISQLFGAIINSRLVDGGSLEVALTFIMTALKKPGALFEFGIKAVEFFKSRLHEWPHIVQQLFENDRLRTQCPEVLQDIIQNLEVKGSQIKIPREYIEQIQSNIQQKISSQQNAVEQPQQQVQKIVPAAIVNQQQGYNYPMMNQGSNTKINKQQQNLNQSDYVIDSPQQLYQSSSNQEQFSQLPNLQRNNTVPPKIIQQPQQIPVSNVTAPFSESNIKSITKGFQTLNINAGVLERAHLPQRSQDARQSTFVHAETGLLTQKRFNFEAYMQENEPEFAKIPEEIKDAIRFTINNSTLRNTEETCNEVKGHLTDPIICRWFAKHVLVKKGSFEQMFQPVYIAIINRLNNIELQKSVLKETLVLIKGLLSDDKPEKKLKTLGSWLGQITLLRNKPIYFYDIDLKGLLCDAVEKKKVGTVLGFVCKILEACGQSNVFTPKNPWITSLLSVLCELNERQDLTTAQKCEISILFNNINANIKDIPKTNFIETRLQRRAKQAWQIPQLPDYVKIDSKNLEGLPPDIDLKAIVCLAIEDAIKEIVKQVISRSVTIAIITTRELALKDFAVEPDEQKLMKGTKFIVQNLAGSLALVTCREPLRMALQKHLKAQLSQNQQIDPNSIEQIVQILTLENLDLGCALIKKFVTDKAIEDVEKDELINQAITKRQEAKKNNEQFLPDASILRALSYLPEPLKPGSQGLTQEQFKIYEDFINIPREKKRDNTLQEYEFYINRFDKELDQVIAMGINPVNEKEVKKNLISMDEIIQNNEKNEETLREITFKTLEKMFSVEYVAYKASSFCDILNKIKPNAKLNRESIQYIFSLDETRRYNFKMIEMLIRRHMISLEDFDILYAQTLERSQNLNAYYGIIRIIRNIVLKEKLYACHNFQRIIDIIQKNAGQIGENSEIYMFLTEITKNKVPKSFKTKINLFNHDFKQMLMQVIKPIYAPTKENIEFFDFCKLKLDQWLTITTEEENINFLQELQVSVLYEDSKLQKFFVFTTEICVKHANDSLKKFENAANLNNFVQIDYSYIDSFTKLIIMLLKSYVPPDNTEMLDKILEPIVIVLTKEHELNKKNFCQRPFFKIFLNLLTLINRPDLRFSENEILSFLMGFGKIFQKLQPFKYPGFSFAWLELISCKYFMAPLLIHGSQTKLNLWYQMHLLIIDLMKLFKEVIDNEVLSKDFMKVYYKGTLRVFLILLHDFNEFLSDFSFALCEEIPDKFMQIRNMVLSAFPPSMRPPDPYTIDINLTDINEFRNMPNIISNSEERLQNKNIYQHLISYLATKSETEFRALCHKFETTGPDNELTIDVPIVNAFVLALPYHAFRDFAQATSDLNLNKINELRLDTYRLLVKILVTSFYEIREFILNAIMNQIRYPNLITYYYINFVLSIFVNPKLELIQEHITRIIVERLICDRPHPWGVMCIFIDLIKNEAYNFTEKSFIKQINIQEIFQYIFKVVDNQPNGANNNDNPDSSVLSENKEKQIKNN